MASGGQVNITVVDGGSASIIVAGGQAPMFTFEHATALHRIFVAFHEAGKMACALCHGVAILPAGMSDERFQWLERWVLAPSDIIRTPGTESNVREIYDACDALARDPANIILNQFNEFAKASGRCGWTREKIDGELQLESTVRRVCDE